MPGKYRQNLYLLAIKTDRSIRTVERWISIPADSKADIFNDDMYKIADFFNCNPQDLINKKLNG